ncbi:MAG: DUF2851 family protein [Bacteroidales bacterium]|nr:DUF2851 family protein [Bacteroidales bacterium]
MKEDFLHYLWKHRLFRFLEVKTTHGELLKIISPGYHNQDAGPDFKQAVIQIGNMKWAGDVEIHLKSSDWYRHQHHLDEKYRSVILHVVYEHDGEVERQKGEYFPTLEMKSYVPAGMYERYCELMRTPETICCENYLPKMDALHLNATLSTMVMERLLRKQQRILEMVAQCQNDWNEALYRQLAIAFGFKTNAVAFELLAHSLPYKILQKHADALPQVNALIFGQAGLLNEEPLDDYQRQLKYEYDYLRYKYQLAPIELYHWNLLRLRPSNFPCVRLSQFAAILHKIPNMMSLLLEDVSAESLRQFFSVEADAYWHYH